ncbi:MBL fold metallo-hydrolase [Haloactinomyces albus]|uniref:Ribonuclease BN (tRNA processing enzyme) n=1 Tax=Haloactinomyces albus TaxID=1352928 RepID=A0AAE4CQ50_9ACTN|nr:hypothetical protein [Haloactinomyces albus]MDR7303807.1 ribonuclease BN (tRNA processing enzyme) [Haloactinomyces albus]
MTAPPSANSGAVTFSGDTAYTDNIPWLAHGGDALLHEAFNLGGSNYPAAVRDHMLESHVEAQKVGPIAQRSQDRRLVLTHIGDLGHTPLDTALWAKWAKKRLRRRGDRR